MLVADTIARILMREGVEYLNCYPNSPLIEASAKAGIRPIVCRQERVGVGIADGYARVPRGRTPSVFAMQHGPGVRKPCRRGGGDLEWPGSGDIIEFERILFEQN